MLTENVEDDVCQHVATSSAEVDAVLLAHVPGFAVEGSLERFVLSVVIRKQGSSIEVDDLIAKRGLLEVDLVEAVHADVESFGPHDGLAYPYDDSI